MAIRAVMFDFGGVVTTSPFEAFARLEAERGLPAGFIRTVNATNPDDNAWARLERSELEPRRLRGGVGGRGPRARTRARWPARAGAALGRCPPAHGRRHRRVPQELQDRLPHQQLRVARARRLRTGGRGVRALRRRAGVTRARRAQTGPSLLRARLCDARRATRGVGLSRRPRRQPQARPCPRHAHHQGGPIPTKRSSSSRRSSGTPSSTTEEPTLSAGHRALRLEGAAAAALAPAKRPNSVLSPMERPLA